MNNQPRPGAAPAPASSGVLYDNSISLQSIETLIGPLHYADRGRVARDVLQLIRNSNSLAVKLALFTQPSGTSENLLQVFGTTPIYYKGNQYNIPVTIWVVEQYPHRPPACFVTPTKDMRIKGGHLHVDHFGTIYLPYLNQWNAQNSNLLEMVTMMSSVFSTDPPVFRVPSGESAAAAGPSSVQQQQQPQQQPSPPQYQLPQPQQQPAQPSRPAQPAMSHPPSQPQQQQQPPQLAPQPPQDPRAVRKNQLVNSITLKLRQHLQDELSLKCLLTDDLLAAEHQLMSHSKAIQEKLAHEKGALQAMETSNTALSAKNEEIRKWLETNENREVTDVDKLCFVKDTWSKQLLDNVVLDNAIDDAYYLLDRSLADGHIDLQSFTKQIRTLSRKQFYARQLAMLITQQQTQHAGGAHPSHHVSHPSSGQSQQMNHYLGGYMQQQQPVSMSH